MRLALKSKNNRSDDKSADLGCVGLALFFVLPYIAFSFFGLSMLRMPLLGLRDYLAMKSWREVPAQILEAQVTSASDGDGGTTYGIEVKYEYAYDGVTRRGTRADIFNDFSDASGAYQRRLVGEWEAAKAGGRSVPCYVNPANPAEAVLDREMCWEMFATMTLFFLPFCVVGFGSLASLVLDWRHSRARAALQSLYPDEPWLWQRDWASGEIRSSSKSGAISLTIFVTLWNLIAFIPLIFSGKALFTKGPSLQWLVLLFPALGVVLIVMAARAWRNWAVLGNAVFRMNRVPGVLGGVLTGTILSRCGRRPDSEVWLTLTCTETSNSDDDDPDNFGKDNTAHILWQDRHAVRPEAVHLEPMGLSLPVLFQIPYDCEESPRTDTETYWRLDLEGQFGGVTGKAQFEVPVFRTAASDSNLKLDRSLEAAAVSIEPLPGGGRRYHFRPIRPLMMVAWQIFFAMILTALAVGICFSEMWPFSPLILYFDFLILWRLLDILFWAGRVEVTTQGVSFTGGIFNRTKAVYVAVNDIQRLVLNVITEIGNTKIGNTENGEKVFYNLQLETRSGKKVTLAKRLKECSLGELLIAEMEKDLLGETTKVGAELNA